MLNYSVAELRFIINSGNRIVFVFSIILNHSSLCYKTKNHQFSKTLETPIYLPIDSTHSYVALSGGKGKYFFASMQEDK